MSAASQADERLDVTSGGDALLECLAIVTRLHGRPISARALAAGLPLEDHRLTPALFVRAADGQGYSARLARRPLNRISRLLLPAVLLLEGDGACVLTALDLRKGEAGIVMPESGFGSRTLTLKELGGLYSGLCLFVQPRPRPDNRVDPAAPESTRSWFWGTLWRFRRYYTEAAMSAVLVNVLTVATALFVMNVYDRVVPNNAIESLIVLATGTLIAVGFEFVARNLRSYFLDVAGKKADILLAGQLFAQALGLRLEARPGSAGAFSAQLREFESLRDFITSATLTTITDLPFVFFFVWLIALLGGPLYLVPLAVVPLVVVVGLIAQIPLSRLMRKHLEESALKHGLLVESIEGLEILKASSAEGILQRRWEDYTALTGQTATRSRLISSLVVNVAALAQQCATVAMVVWGVFLIGAGELSVGGLIACVILMGRGLAPLGQVAALLVRYQQARASHTTLNELMRRPLDREPGRRYLHRPTVRGEIAFRELKFAYPGQKLAALDGVSARIGAGEHVAVLGRIGSGKSTLLKLALGLYRPTGGTILIDGTDQDQFDPADLRHHIGYVGQEARLFHGTLRDNVTLAAPLADDGEVLQAARLAGLDKLIEQHPLGFDLPIGEGGAGLSGGQRQAVAIARTLLMRPRVLLLDEPTSAMDFSAEQTFMAHLKQFTRGRTLVLVTHKPSMLTLVDRVLVLEGGRIVADGPRDEVLKQLIKPV
ncbi:MAG: type I secretion system permease/ATPase [Gammaproteobacteria bacterium]|nr:type I secretion system permease/ATPase [Gammaproteobacteria bacterium]